MRGIRNSLLTVVLLVGMTATAEAQSSYKWNIEGFFSFTAVSGDFASFVQSGYGGGAQVAYILPSNIWIIGGFSALILGGEGSLVDWKAYSFIADVGYNLTKGSGFGDAVLFGGVGATNFNPDSDAIESKTNFAVNGGFKLGLRISDRVALPINLAGAYVFTDDTVLGNGVWLFPLTIGLAVRF